MIISPHLEGELRRMGLVCKPSNADVVTVNSLYICFGPCRSSARLSLTGASVRHNITYIQFVGRSHGQTQKARSKTAGAQAHRYPQPSPHRCLRQSVPRESVLRLQRPAASALRDAAPSPRGRRFHRRCLFDVRSLAPDLLSGTNGIRAQWPDWPATQTARSQGRAQAIRPGNRARPELEDFRTQLDHRRMRQGRRGEVRYHRSSSQPGTGAGGQKKTPPAHLRFPVPTGTTEAYETLRQRVVQPDGRIEHTPKAEASSSAVDWRDGRKCRSPPRPNGCLPILI